MKRKTAPRPNLAPSAEAEAPPIALTHTLIAFLRSEMRVYKALVRRGGASLSDEKLAEAIQDCPAVSPPVAFSPETLRRFLKHDPQKHGDDFLRAVVQFLLAEKWITPADIAAHDKDANVRAAVALQGFFGALPHKKTLEFYKDIEGSFVRFARMPDRILREVFYISTSADPPPVLRVRAETEHYRTSAAELILRESEGLSPAWHHKIGRLLETYAEQVGATRHSLGFGIADPRIIAFFLRSELTGDATIHLVHTVTMADDDEGRIDVLRSARYAGWAMVEGKAEAGCEMHRVHPAYSTRRSASAVPVNQSPA